MKRVHAHHCPTLTAICERVYAARRGLILRGVDVEEFVVEIAPTLWQRLMREVGDDPTVTEGKMMGLRARRCNQLEGDEIRLRYEVIA